MACSTTITGRALPCKDSLGGIKKIWVVSSVGGDATVSFVEGNLSTVSSGTVANSTSATILKSYEMHKNVGSFTQTLNVSPENGTIFYTQVVSCQFSKEVASDIGGFQDMIKGRLAIVVQDVNDNYFVVGHTRGCEVTAGSVESGVALGDFNGLKYEFTAHEAIAAPFLTNTGANLTFTATT